MGFASIKSLKIPKVIPPQRDTEKFIPAWSHCQTTGPETECTIIKPKVKFLEGGISIWFRPQSNCENYIDDESYLRFLHNRHDFAKKKSGSTAASILNSSQHLPPQKMYRTQRPRTSWHIFWAAHSEVFGQAYTRCARVEGRATPKARFFASTTSFLVPFNVRFEQTRFSHRAFSFLLKTTVTFE